MRTTPRPAATVVATVLATALLGCSAASPPNRPTGPRTADTRTSDAWATDTRATAATPPASAPPTVRRAPAGSAPAAIPPVSPRARAAGLVDIRTVVPDAVIDLRYATVHNFTHVRLYPSYARCLVHRSMTRGLRIAASRLRHHGLVLVFWDCYRPHWVQEKMFRVVPDPNWVARPGPYATSHEAGRSVDVTLAGARVGGACAHRAHGHCLLPMGTGFDDFTDRAHAYATKGVSARAEANRALLRHAMRRGGITVYTGEWWHFDGPGSKVPRPHLHAPVH